MIVFGHGNADQCACHNAHYKAKHRDQREQQDLVFTEKDEFIYHEMISHVPMAVHPNVRKVLVIGGGDGGVVRELIKYKNIEKTKILLYK